MVGVIKRENELYIVKYSGKASKDLVNNLSDRCCVTDTQFLIQLPNGKYDVCLKKKSAWMKEQIKNAVSE